MAKLFRRSFIPVLMLAIGILVVAACGDSSTPTPSSQPWASDGRPPADVAGDPKTVPQLPVMSIAHNGRNYDGVHGSYCWLSHYDNDDPVGICADKVAWQGLDDVDPVPVRNSSSVTVHIQADEPPQDLRASVFDVAPGTKPMHFELEPGLKTSLATDLDDGTYNVRISGNWTDGQMDYEFRLKVGSAERLLVLAPIESVNILTLESFPPQYMATVISGLPNGCAEFDHYTEQRQNETIRIEVINSFPADVDVACTDVYRITETNINMGSEFEPGETYTVVVNDVTETFVAQ